MIYRNAQSCYIIVSLYGNITTSPSLHVILKIKRKVKRDVKLKALERTTVLEHYIYIYIKSLNIQLDL